MTGKSFDILAVLGGLSQVSSCPIIACPADLVYRSNGRIHSLPPTLSSTSMKSSFSRASQALTRWDPTSPLCRSEAGLSKRQTVRENFLQSCLSKRETPAQGKIHRRNALSSGTKRKKNGADGVHHHVLVEVLSPESQLVATYRYVVRFVSSKLYSRERPQFWGVRLLVAERIGM